MLDEDARRSDLVVGLRLAACWTKGGNCRSLCLRWFGEIGEGIDATIATGTTGTRTGTPTGPGAQPEQCVVPRLRGVTLSAAKRALSAARCKLGKRTRRSDAKVKRGRVIGSKPKAGSSLPVGSKVELVISKGARRR